MMRMLGLAVLVLLVMPATGLATCTVSASGVTFGTYVPTSGADLDAIGTVTVSANAASCGTYTLALGRTGTSYNPRVFTTGATTGFEYNLFTSSARATIWGDGTAGSQPVTGASLGANGSRSHTVYGRIPASQSVAPGAYSAQVAVNASTTSGTITPSTQNFVAATTVATCTISATNMAFGTYAGAVLNTTATITINCTNTTPYNVGLNAGTATGATVTTRKMKSGANLLNYALFSNAGRTTNWGSIPAQGVAGTGSGSTQALTVYGRVTAGQSAAPGAYADAIIATVTY